MAEQDLGLLSKRLGVISRSDSIGFNEGRVRKDTEDTYSFRTLSSVDDLNVSLTGMSDNADVRLFRDVNRNGLIDDSDRLMIAIA